MIQLTNLNEEQQKFVNELKAMGYSEEQIFKALTKHCEDLIIENRKAHYKELENIAYQRGWSVNISSGDYSVFHCIKMNEDHTIDFDNHFVLSVYVDSEEFEFIAGCLLTIRLTTDRVGSFRNEEYFLKFEDKMHQMANSLWRRGFMATSPQNRADY